jgi:3-hydroxyisobutyrate dehydrogenase-like beta-hydroxyacid dehydrogenase
MALRLQNHLSAQDQHPLLFSNRTLSRGAPLEEIGAVAKGTIEDLVHKSTIVFTMVRAVATT